eukprot:4943972-Pleurochrysis_carterae.AAC.1
MEGRHEEWVVWVWQEASGTWSNQRRVERLDLVGGHDDLRDAQNVKAWMETRGGGADERGEGEREGGDYLANG